MSRNLQFDFIVDKNQCTITIKREFAAQRQLVWDCYTKSELLDRWFAPKPLQAHTKSIDFREGGHWHFSMTDPAGKQYWSWFDYLTINPIENYTALDGFCNEEGELNSDLPRAENSTRFIDAGQHTLVESLVTYPNEEALNTVLQMGLEAGLTSTLIRLDELLAGIK